MADQAPKSHYRIIGPGESGERVICDHSFAIAQIKPVERGIALEFFTSWSEWFGIEDIAKGAEGTYETMAQVCQMVEMVDGFAARVSGGGA